MIEDKLSSGQRIRLEALSQAVQVTIAGGLGNIMSAITSGGQPTPGASAEVVIETASRFERWIDGGSTDDT